MEDKNVSLRNVIAWALWTVGLMLILAHLFGWANLGHLGLYAAGAGGVLHIRGFFERLLERERNCFEVGRDYERHKLASVD